MLWIIILILNLHRIHAGLKGTTITCECTTLHCIEHNMKHCNTTSMCFSQYLERHDGSHPVVRGCIKSKTPLLCENRRPAVAKGSWPVLLCCNSNLCNRDVVPTAPPWFVQSVRDNDTMVSDEDSVLGKHEAANDYRHQKDQDDEATPPSSQMLSFEDASSSLGSSFKTKNRSSSLPHIISPIYISVVILGIICLIIIGIIAAVVLKRNNRYYTEQYGTLEHQHEQNCLKHNMSYAHSAHTHCDCDSEVESLSQCSQPYIQVIYPDRDSNGT
ncbi:uncharacterized protein TNCT_344001 [Trichonephila clavata]|uniref:Activin types I and II receptor domain-containing protein n=1 Tax=Trichonephila clavata TaxID=2740835 RepID=A0A8X6L2W0_TRICU|nr:uncharacterized protein TNCT_344001 [Trichonephila clavata]